MRLMGCVSCVRLGRCSLVDEQKLMTNFYCNDHKEVEHEEETSARVTALQRFGLAAATAMIKPPPQEAEEG